MTRLNFGHPLKTKNDVKMINLNKQNIDLNIISFHFQHLILVLEIIFIIPQLARTML